MKPLIFFLLVFKQCENIFKASLKCQIRYRQDITKFPIYHNPFYLINSLQNYQTPSKDIMLAGRYLFVKHLKKLFVVFQILDVRYLQTTL